MKTLGPKGFGGKDGALSGKEEKRGERESEKVMGKGGDISNLISATFQFFLDCIFQDWKKHQVFGLLQHQVSGRGMSMSATFT